MVFSCHKPTLSMHHFPTQLSEYVHYLLDQLEPMGPIKAVAMFGGYGLYLDDLMFALVANDCLYLKADDELQSEFEDLHCQPFTYVRKNKKLRMSYYAPTEDIFDNQEEMLVWAGKAYAAALRAATKRATATKRKK